MLILAAEDSVSGMNSKEVMKEMERKGSISIVVHTFRLLSPPTKVVFTRN